jgi:hypothetical protein
MIRQTAVRLPVTVALWVGLAALPAIATAQGPSGGATGGLVFESYRFDTAEATGIEGLSLLTLPFGASARLRQNLTVELGGAYARASLDRSDGRQVELAGLTDTQLRLALDFGGETRAVVQAIVVLPTGKATHDPEEALVAGAVAADLLPFRISHWGNGGAVGLSTAVRRSTGSTTYGAGVSYLIGREFNPVDGEPFAYRPGDQFRARATLDHLIRPASKLTLAVTAERHSEDTLEGANLYRAGNRYNVVGAYSFPVAGRAAAIAYSGIFHRTQGTALLEQAPESLAQTLLLIGSGVRFPMSFGVLIPTADARLLRSEDGSGQGHLLGGGLMAELRSGNLVLLPSVRGRFGRVVVREGSESGITGLELGLTARFRERRP